MSLTDLAKDLIKSLNSDEKGQLNVALFGPLVVIFGALIVVLGLLMINAIGSSTIATNAQQTISTQPGVQNMIAFVPFAGIGVVVGGILLTLLTVVGFSRR